MVENKVSNEKGAIKVQASKNGREVTRELTQKEMEELAINGTWRKIIHDIVEELKKQNGNNKRSYK